MIKALVLLLAVVALNAHGVYRKDYRSRYGSSSRSGKRGLLRYRYYNRYTSRSSSRSWKRVPVKSYSKSESSKSMGVLYHKDTVNNVNYYYPTEAFDKNKISGNELALLAGIGGESKISEILDILVDKLIKADKVMYSLCYSYGLAKLKKELMDFFVALLNGGGSDFLHDLLFAFRQIDALRKINLSKFVEYTVRAADEAGVKAEYLSVIRERLYYCVRHSHWR